MIKFKPGFYNDDLYIRNSILYNKGENDETLSHEDEGDMDNSPEFYRLFFLRLIEITYQISHK